MSISLWCYAYDANGFVGWDEGDLCYLMWKAQKQISTNCRMYIGQKMWWED